MSKKAFFCALGAAAFFSTAPICAEETVVQEIDTSHAALESPDSSSQWLPANKHVFPQLKADPRQPRFSASYRWHDKAFHTHVAAPSMGGDVPLWYGTNCGYFDEIQVGVQGGVWGIFDMKAHNLDLINSDWYGGIPVYLRTGDIRWRFRFYHISSHMGDEWIINNGVRSRKNPSYESVDLTAYMPVWKDQLFVYGCVGHILHSDNTFPMDRTYLELGAEIYGQDMTWNFTNLKAVPYAAIHSRWAEMHNFKPGVNTVIGLVWSDKNSQGHQLTTSLEYYAGHSIEGQFGKLRTHFAYFQVAYIP